MLQPKTARKFWSVTTPSLLPFDWDSAALAYLYYRLDTICRGAVTMCDFWHVLHVCFLSLFTFLISYIISLYWFISFQIWGIETGLIRGFSAISLDMSLPLMQRWGSSRLSSSRHDLQTYREHLNSLEWDVVRQIQMISILWIINLN